MKKQKKISYPEVPNELVRKILSSLPARSICRFRCVSKYWLSLLENQGFLDDIPAQPPVQIEIQHNNLLRYFSDNRGLSDNTLNHYMAPFNKDNVVSNYRRWNSFICCQYDDNTLLLTDLSDKDSFYLLPTPPFPAGFNFEFGFDTFSNEYKVLVWKDGASTSDFYLVTLTTNNNTNTNTHTFSLPTCKNDGSSPRFITLESNTTNTNTNTSPGVLTLGSSGAKWRRPFGGVPLWSKPRSFEKSFVTTTGMIYLFDGAEFISFNLATEQFKVIQLPSTVLYEFDIIEHPSLVEDEFESNQYADPALVYDGGEISKIELPPSVYNASQRTVQSDFSYSMFEYEGRLCWVEQSSFTSVVKQWAISGIWMLKENNAWVRLMRKVTLPPTFGLPGSQIWSQKHSHFSSTRSGEIIIVSSNYTTREVIVMYYNFFDRRFVTDHRRLPICNSNVSCRELN